MTKIYRLENLDCANCAAKIEQKVKKIDGVSDVVVNFMNLKMILTADDSIFDSVYEKAKKIINKIEPDVLIKRVG